MTALCWILCLTGIAVLPLRAEQAYIPGNALDREYEDYATNFLAYYCYDCHDDGITKADLNLLDLGPVDETNASIWKAIWAQLAIEEMPPKKEDQPEVLERLQFTDWIVSELERVMEDKGGFHAHREPKKANFVNHDLLFGNLPDGIQLEPTSSPKRIWRLTPSEHITRLNELINTEPEYDPKKPGLRTHGDAVSTNHGGELKLYFGVDRITHWEGGTVAYATAVKSVPVVFAAARSHGFENYAHFSSVNSAEATQILNKAGDILKYMAYGPGSLVKFPEQITDDVGTYHDVKPKGDIRGLPSSLIYSTKVIRPLTPVYELLKEPKMAYSDKEIREAINYLFEMLTFRPAKENEVDDYLDLVRETIAKVGSEDGLIMGLSAIFLDRDALFRPELGEGGVVDEHGRVMLQDWELGLALNHALSYIKPDEILRQAIVDGRMRTKEDVKREITRMLDDDSFRKPRVLQFFREYFDYDLGGYICKDEKAIQAAGVKTKSAALNKGMFRASASTDRLVELILAEDKEVLKELLTTQQVVASPNDSILFGKQNSPDDKAEVPKKLQKTIAKDAELMRQFKELEARKDELKVQYSEKGLSKEEKKELYRQFASASAKVKEFYSQIGGSRKQSHEGVTSANLNGPEISARVGYRSFGKGSLTPERKLATAPEGQRMGILTHPAWLVSHSDAMDNHAIHRGIWVRERLLGGGIPDVPITVDAQLPDEPGTTLRSRMRVTREKYCWSCHEKMDPLGLPFEMYNHIGLYREYELGEPVDASGEIIDSGDPALNGPVNDAIEMINKLVESERVEQVFVRHAFRYWMGRNETLHDGPVLQDAYRAYRDSGGSMKALITSLVTSDAFLYRK
ncbi:DUF1588 domain-containing protein [Rubritalea spongiae]|uniref:DUF1588 domain-containing protein n=1 Tax=Rubritalea spongiae TaxID=430797 RepID=A0ABW5E401_9BACT